MVLVGLLFSSSAFAKKLPKAEGTLLEAPEFVAQADGSSELTFLMRGAPPQPNLQGQGERWQLQFGTPVTLGVQAKRPLLTEAFGGALQSVRTVHQKKSVVVSLSVRAGTVPTLSAESPSGDTLRVHVHIPAAAPVDIPGPSAKQ